MGKYICIGKNRISFGTPKQGGIISDDRWITINADEEEGRKGQHVLIKENGTIVWGLGGKFKHLSELGKNNGLTFKPVRDYNCDLAKELGKEHYDKIRDLIEQCPNENLKKVMIKRESQVGVGDAKYNGGAYSTRSYIYVNIKNDAMGDDFSKPYETTMHEIGHVIDNTFSRPATYKTGSHGIEVDVPAIRRLSIEYKNGIFGQTISDEITEAVDKLDSEARKDFKEHGKDYEWLYKNSYITFRERQKIKRGLANPPQRYSKTMAYRKFWRTVNDNEKFEDLFCLRDIVGGVTKNKIGSGHTTEYWKDKDDLYGKNAGVAIEAFAEFTSSTLTNPGSLKVIKKYLPKSYKIYQEMLEEAAKKA